MTEATDTPTPEAARKKAAGQRIRELLDERKRDRVRIRDLERQLAERSPRDEAEQQATTLERIARANDQGRKLFRDWDAVTAPILMTPKAFEALLASQNGVELFYAMGLGVHFLTSRAQKQQLDDRVAYYRELHQQHFKGATS